MELFHGGRRIFEVRTEDNGKRSIHFFMTLKCERCKKSWKVLELLEQDRHDDGYFKCPCEPVNLDPLSVRRGVLPNGGV